MRVSTWIAPLALGSGLVACSSLFCPVAQAQPAPVPDQSPYEAKIAPASDEGARAIAKFRIPEGFRVELFAAEPMLANPVCLALDERNRVYVAETFRLHSGVTDNRRHMAWLADDLAARTIADRVAMYRKHLTPEEFAAFGVDPERVRLLEDRDGDGRADRASVFADGFHGVADGIGAGLLARNGDVYYTCIPALLRLRDADGDGRAEVRQALHQGYGVHVAFLGHDLHGLRFGPDGRLYFSVGDRGLNVQQGGRSVVSLDSGAILRCNPDGSELEIVATGLRNPQELVFDEHGNLFTGDNNSDGGDKARWVYVVEGGDSGWRIGYQYLVEPVNRGPWNAEKLWHPHWEGQAAYLVPPIANIADGPSGLTYDPGTGLPARYRRHFFLADFRGGTSAQSGIRSFAVRPQGASFELVDPQQFLWSVLPTDVDFGSDGALYVLDWVEGWNKTGKGRIYK
ncbi:MAG TPA: PVC-type heme-binding CxxCH protein, partial [Isosphaeraceae bacterium]